MVKEQIEAKKIWKILSKQKWGPRNAAFQVSANGLYSRHDKIGLNIKQIPIINHEVNAAWHMTPIGETSTHIYYSR